MEDGGCAEDREARHWRRPVFFWSHSKKTVLLDVLFILLDRAAVVVSWDLDLDGLSTEHRENKKTTRHEGGNQVAPSHGITLGWSIVLQFREKLHCVRSLYHRIFTTMIGTRRVGSRGPVKSFSQFGQSCLWCLRFLSAELTLEFRTRSSWSDCVCPLYLCYNINGMASPFLTPGAERRNSWEGRPELHIWYVPFIWSISRALHHPQHFETRGKNCMIRVSQWYFAGLLATWSCWLATSASSLEYGTWLCRRLVLPNDLIWDLVLIGNIISQLSWTDFSWARLPLSGLICQLQSCFMECALPLASGKLGGSFVQSWTITYIVLFCYF